MQIDGGTRARRDNIQLPLGGKKLDRGGRETLSPRGTVRSSYIMAPIIQINGGQSRPRQHIHFWTFGSSSSYIARRSFSFIRLLGSGAPEPETSYWGAGRVVRCPCRGPGPLQDSRMKNHYPCFLYDRTCTIFLLCDFFNSTHGSGNPFTGFPETSYRRHSILRTDGR